MPELTIQRLNIELAGNLINPQTGAGESGSTASLEIAELIAIAFANGTGAGQANAIWPSKGRTIVSTEDEVIDLFDFGSIDIGAGPGLDPLSQPLTLATIVGLVIYNRPTSAGNLLVGGEASAAAWNSPFNGDDEAKLVLHPGSPLLLASPTTGYAVADTSNHLLELAAPAGNVTYDIFVIGRETT